MGINIRGIGGNSVTTQTKKTGNAKTAGKATDGQASGSADSINLTDAASLIQKAEQALAAIPTINAKHVEEVSRKISDGSYQIDDEQIADKIIEQETGFLNKR